MAIRRMYTYYQQEGHDVEMRDLGLSGYPHKRREIIDGSSFDRVYVSNIFDINKDRVAVAGCSDVTFGGIGSCDPHLQLPPEIEATPPWYGPEEKTSYGFITRGCIRNCWFCKVPKYEGALKEYNPVESIVRGVPGEVVKFLIDYTAYCNQAAFFKKMNFAQFLERRHPKNEARRTRSLQVYTENGGTEA